MGSTDRRDGLDCPKALTPVVVYLGSTVTFYDRQTRTLVQKLPQQPAPEGRRSMKGRIVVKVKLFVSSSHGVREL